jgi:cation diffusion facilitator family transporter
MIESMKGKVRLMKLMLFFSIVLLSIKFFAWWITSSNAILTDALESIVNVVAGSFALFSIIYASRPRDKEHPYGHGKIEYVSAGFEGALILLAGGGILYEAIMGFLHPHPINKIDFGAILTGCAGAANYLMGYVLLQRGKKQHSALMKADGKHLISDSISSAGLVIGLLLIYFTKLTWIDNALAVGFGSYIIFTGVKIVRESLGNLLDEQDEERIDQLIDVLNEHRRDNWIDMHNVRILKYGSGLHVDAHITLPWYYSLEQAHTEVDAVDMLVRSSMGEEMEFFIHADPCILTSCSICSIKDCPQRKAEMKRKITWTKENMLPDSKHSEKTR